MPFKRRLPCVGEPAAKRKTTINFQRCPLPGDPAAGMEYQGFIKRGTNNDPRKQHNPAILLGPGSSKYREFLFLLRVKKKTPIS